MYINSGFVLLNVRSDEGILLSAIRNTVMRDARIAMAPYAKPAAVPLSYEYDLSREAVRILVVKSGAELSGDELWAASKLYETLEDRLNRSRLPDERGKLL